MIFGIGNDIIDILRIKNTLDRFPVRFIQKILSPLEKQTLSDTLSNTLSNTQLPQYIAGRWAAKEAIGKALGIGMRAPCHWQNISISNNTLGQPYFIFAAPLKALLDEKGINYYHLSIAHDNQYALATVILER